MNELPPLLRDDVGWDPTHGFGADTQALREINRWVLLNTLRNQGPSTRARLARQTRLSATTVTNIVRELIDQGWIKEIGSQQAEQNIRWSGGRQAIEVAFNAQAGAVLGGEMGRTRLRLLLTDLAGQPLKASEPIALATDQGPERYLPRLIAVLDDFVRDIVSWDQIFGIGLGLPGPISLEGRPFYPPRMPGWHDHDLVSEIAAHARGLFDPARVAIYLENDTNFGALGESRYGADPQSSRENLAYIKVSTGIGAGFVLRQQLYRGTTGSAGEFGHSKVEARLVDTVRQCPCGKLDCLEAYAAADGIVQDVQLKTGEAALTIETVLERAAARGATSASAQALELAGQRLGAAIGMLINVLDPTAVIVDGLVPQSAREAFLGPLRATVHEYSLRHDPPIPIELSTLGGYAIAWGGIARVLDTLFQRPPVPTARPLLLAPVAVS